MVFQVNAFPAYQNNSLFYTNVCKSAFRKIFYDCLIYGLKRSKDIVQSTAKLFEPLRWYMRFFSDLIANVYYLMLVINSIKPKDHNLKNICFIKLDYVWVFWKELSQVLE